MSPAQSVCTITDSAANAITDAITDVTTDATTDVTIDATTDAASDATTDAFHNASLCPWRAASFPKSASWGKVNGGDFGANDNAQWFRTIKNQDVSTKPLARPFAHSLGPLTDLLSLPCLLRSRASLRSFVCSLTHSRACGKVKD